MGPQTEVRPGIERVRLAIVVACKSEIAEGLKLGKLWIEPRTDIVAPVIAHMLIGDRVRQLVVYLLRQSYRTDKHPIAPPLVGFVEGTVESYTLNRGRKYAADEGGRKC